MNNRSRRGAAAGYLRITTCIVAWIVPSILMAHGPIDQRIADLTAQIQNDPINASLYLERGELHRHHRDWAAALTDYDRAQQLSPTFIGIDFFRGQMLFDAGRHDEALAVLNRYLTQQPDQPDALLIRARVLVKLGEPWAAAQDFKKAIDRISEPQPGHYLERATALASMGDGYIAPALQGLDEGLERLGQLATLQLYAIDLEVKRARHDAALARLDKIAAQSPVKAHWLLRRGQILEAAQRPYEARMSYEAAVAEIRSLPSSRRDTKANRRLEVRLAAGLERVSYTSEDSKAEAPLQAQ
ncbi:MAG: tetratricopeptide repeat protein [Chromatiales bacterium]